MADFLDLGGELDSIQRLITPHGGYNFVRTKEMAERAGRKLCSTGNYPCTHRGVDLAAAEGTEVLAPEHGYVLYAIDGDDVRPFSRYGPALVVLAGGSGYYHLIAHLAPPNPFGDYRIEDDGTIESEIPRAQKLSRPLIPAYRGDKDTDYGVPENQMPMFQIETGQSLGFVSEARHVHWEVRRQPKDKLTTISPIDWIASKGRGPATGSGGIGLLLLLAGYLYSRRR